MINILLRYIIVGVFVANDDMIVRAVRLYDTIDTMTTSSYRYE